MKYQLITANWQLLQQLGTGKRESWTDEWALDVCKTKFRGSSIASLEFKIVLDTWGVNLHTDDLKLCKVTVEFVDPSSKWEWSSVAETKPCSGCYSTESDWYNMTLISKK